MSTDAPRPTIVKKRRAGNTKSRAARKTPTELFATLGFTIDALKRYEEVRASGCVNMLDTAVQRLANITEDEHNAIICCTSFYSTLVARFVKSGGVSALR